MSLRKGYAGEVFRSSRAAIRMSLIRRGGPEQMLTIHKQEHAPGRRGFREQCDKYTAVEGQQGDARLCHMIEHIQDVKILKILGFLINTCRSMERLCILASENG